MSRGCLVNSIRERADGPRFRLCMLISSANEFNPATVQWMDPADCPGLLRGDAAAPVTAVHEPANPWTVHRQSQ